MEKLYAVKQKITYALQDYYRNSESQKRDILLTLDGIADGIYLYDRPLGLEVWKHYFEEYVNRVGNACLKELYENQDKFPMSTEFDCCSQMDLYKYDFSVIRDLDKPNTAYNKESPFIIEMTESHTHMYFNKTKLDKPYGDVFVYFIWYGGYCRNFIITTDVEEAKTFANDLPEKVYNEYAQAEMYIPAVQDIWREISEPRRNKINYNTFLAQYGQCISTCIDYCKGVEQAKISFNVDNYGSQTQIYFSVISKVIPQADRYNWYGDNVSQNRYNGAIVIDDEGNISIHT